RTSLATFAVAEFMAMFWALHLCYGRVTSSSLDALFALPLEVRSLIGRYAIHRRMVGRGAFALVVGICGQEEADSFDTKGLAYLFSPDGDAWLRRQLDAINADIPLNGDEILVLKKYGSLSISPERLESVEACI